jgi:hypothetical protein
MEGAEVGSSSSLENYGDLRVNGSMPSPSSSFRFRVTGLRVVELHFRNREAERFLFWFAKLRVPTGMEFETPLFLHLI